MSLLDVFEGSPLENVGKETILHFIQNTVSKHNTVDAILDNVSKKHQEEHTVSVVEEGEDEPRHITASAKGFYYERLWDICIKFGVTDLTLGIHPDKPHKHQTTHIFDNSNKESIKVSDNCWEGTVLKDFLHQNVRSGNSGGYSDITFVNKAGENAEEVYFLSVKYFKIEKDIGEYDIGKLCTLIREHEQKHRTIKLYICVKNKKEAIEKFNKQHRSSAILLKYINPGGKYEHVYDSKDLQRFYFNLKKVLEQYNYFKEEANITRFNDEYMKTLKEVFIPRFHQKLFISKINELIDKRQRRILVGAIPRSGKSYIMAGTILEYVKKHAQAAGADGKKLNFLLMTPAPNETFPEYKSIFDRHIDFDKHGIETKLYNEQSIKSAVDKHTIHIISKQRLGYIESDKPKREPNQGNGLSDDLGDGSDPGDDETYIQKIRENLIKIFKNVPHFDIIFLDEAHFGMSTIRAQKIVEELTRTFDEHKDTTQVYVTATYRRPLKEYNVLEHCKMTWDLTDIEVMKHFGEPKYPINGNKIEKQFGEKIYTETLEYYGDKKGVSIASKLKKDYAKYPKPYLLTPLWDKEFVKVERSKLGDTEFGWDMDKLFSTKGDSFENVEQVKEMMRYYFGYPNKEKNYEEQSFYRTRGIIPRIRNICANNCRTQQQRHKTTQLWFLPVGTGKIQDKINALITLLTNVKDFKDIANTYHFYAAIEVDTPTDTKHVTYMKEPRNIKKEIEALERVLNGDVEDRRKISGDNLIILAGQRLQLGISLRNVDIVTLWNSIKSADAIFQMLFRSMTEVDTPKCHEDDEDDVDEMKIHEYCGEKKFGFMVDMDPQRALTNISLFSDITIKKKNEDDEVHHYKEITDLINIDEDVFHDRFGDDDAARNEFVKELFDKLYSSWNNTVEMKKEIIASLSFNMEELEVLKPQLKQIYTDKRKNANQPDDGDENTNGFDKKKGRKKEEDETKDTTGNKKKPKPEINLKEKATEIISEYISLLNIFTLYRDEGTKCILSDTLKENNTKAKVINNINQLKKIVFKNDKDIFLQILKERLTGNEQDTDIITEDFLNKILDTISDEKDNLMINKISMAQKKQYYTIHEPDKLLEYINENIKPKAQERKEHGEVFTPLLLVIEMLNELDKAYIKQNNGRSIFSERDFRWFDPSVGIGNFPIIVYQRLMEGLKHVISGEEARRKHILENMIYASELTPKNVFIYKKIFCGDSYKLNIHEGDTLKMDVRKDFNLPPDFKGFDVVMGNPPFQGHDNKKKIYINFVINTLNNLLNVDAYFLFITPKQIIRILLGENIQQQQIQKLYNILYLNTRNTIKTDYFKTIGSDFMYFILQNREYQGSTLFINDDNNENSINLKFNSFLPLNSNVSPNITNKLLISGSTKSLWRKAARIDAMSDEDIKKNDIVDVKDKDHKNKLVIFLRTNPKDDLYKWTSKEHPDMFKYKVIYPSLGERYVIVDKDDKLFTGTTSVLYILCNSINECENVVKLGKSKLFSYLKKAYTGKNPIDSVWNNLIKPSSFDIEIKDDADIYKYFNLSKDDIEEIEHQPEISVTQDESTLENPIHKKEPIKSNKKKEAPVVEVTDDIPITYVKPIPIRNSRKKNTSKTTETELDAPIKSHSPTKKKRNKKSDVVTTSYKKKITTSGPEKPKRSAKVKAGGSKRNRKTLKKRNV
jgi:hypothetical protein